MRKLFLIILLCSLSGFTYAQTQNDATKKLTKFEVFTSRTGRIIKFIDVNMPSISENFMGSLETGIRIIMGADHNAYFYRVEEPETNRSIAHIAMIEYSDLVEINKALVKLASEVDSDCTSNPDYLENKFVTDDGFQVGYYVSKGKASWYLKLERYENSIIFVQNVEEITTNFNAAQKKIEELQQKYGK